MDTQCPLLKIVYAPTHRNVLSDAMLLQDIGDTVPNGEGLNLGHHGTDETITPWAAYLILLHYLHFGTQLGYAATGETLTSWITYLILLNNYVPVCPRPYTLDPRP
eukprot:788248-Rhodomonas_salina.1